MINIKIDRAYFFTILIFSLIIIGSTTTTLTYATFIMLIFLFIIAIYYYTCICRKSVLIAETVVLLLLFQNFLIGIGAHLGKNFNNELSIMTQVPTIFIFISFSFYMLHTQCTARNILFCLYVLLCATFFAKGRSPLMIKSTYFRNFIIFYMAFFLAEKCINTRESLDDFVDFFLSLSIVATIFGLVGTILGREFYFLCGVREVYFAKKYRGYVNGLPGNFVTTFFGKNVNRLVSLYYEPVNFSYFMAISVTIAFLKRKKKLFIIFLICEVLTFGKGGLLLLLLSLLCTFIQIIFEKFNKNLIRFMILLGMPSGLFMTIYFFKTSFQDNFGTYAHFNGMQKGLEYVFKSPFGNGMGSTGNLIGNTAGGFSETGLITMAYQIGVPGTILFSFILLSLANNCFKNYQKSGNRFCLLYSYIPFALLLVSVYQENTYTPQCIVPSMIFVGGLSNWMKREDTEI